MAYAVVDNMGEEMSPPSHLKVICTTQGSSYKLNYTNIRGKLGLRLDQMSSRSGFKLGRRGEMSGRTFGPYPPNQHIRLGYFLFYILIYIICWVGLRVKNYGPISLDALVDSGVCLSNLSQGSLSFTSLVE